MCTGTNIERNSITVKPLGLRFGANMIWQLGVGVILRIAEIQRF